jgi:hypothetical protein
MLRAVVLTSLFAALAFASLWYLTAPPRNSGEYRHRAAVTAELLRSQVQTARLLIQMAQSDRATSRFVTVGFEEAEADAVDTGGQFLAYDPPQRDEELRTRLEALSSETTSALAQARIAVHAGRSEELASVVDRLRRLAERLDSFAREAEA